MGIELPGELAEIAQLTGAKWPEADEDAMRAQAGAWRDAAGKLTSLAADADGSAGGALEAMRGEAGDAARSMWGKFVDPDKGSLTAAAHRSTRAADRLEHAAGQVADAKVEMVRQLVTAAKNRDAAQAAAGQGHPTALLGLDSLLGGTATNLASVTDSLAGAVGDTGRALSTAEVVNPNPGAHSARGQGGLLAATTGLGADVVSRVTDAAGGGVNTVARTADGLHGTAGRVVDAGAAVVDEGAGAVRDLGEAAGAGVRETAGAAADTAREVGDTAGATGRGVADVVHREVSPSAPTPPSGIGMGHPGGGSFADAPTPPSGIGVGPGPLGPHGVPRVPHVPGGTSVAGFTDAPPASVAAGPAAAGPLPGAPPQAGASFQGGPFGQAPIGGAPAGPGAPAGGGAPTAGPVAGGGQAQGQAPGSAQPRPERAPLRSPGAYPGAPGAPVHKDPRLAPPQPRPPAPPLVGHQPQAPAQQLGGYPAYGMPRTDRASVVALFLVHMFPIGHLPRATGEPARQLPAPPPEADFAPGLRFEPHDHPESHTVDLGQALGRARAAQPCAPGLDGLPADHPVVAGLLHDYDPLADMHERGWDRRYVVRPGTATAPTPEYAWPPGELYPEGGVADGEPIVLEPGVLIDRFGQEGGRVFSEDGTRFRARALPPALVGAGYHRYRVVRALPMWRATSASWFGQPGGGVRYRAVYPAGELVALGYLEELVAPEADTLRTKVPVETERTQESSTGESA